MKKIAYNRVSLIALAAAAAMTIHPGMAHAAMTVQQMQSEINDLQAQINALSMQQDAVNAQVADNAVAVKKLNKKKTNGPNDWEFVNNGGGLGFQTGDGKNSFIIGGQVELDAGFGTVPNQHGVSGATAFRRIEFEVKGVYAEHFLYKIEEDFTKTTSPLGGLLDAYLGYQNKTGPVNNVFLAGNQHTPFGFQTDSSSTLFLENDMGNSLFQDGRLLGFTGQTYNKNINAWYGILTTNGGFSPGQSNVANGTTNSITTGASEFTLSGDLAYNIINRPGMLLSIRDSEELNRYNANKFAANAAALSTSPDINLYGTKFLNISASSLPLAYELVSSPRIDFEYGPLTLAAAFYDADTNSTTTTTLVKGKPHISPKFTSYDLEAEYFLTPDYEPYSDYHGYYGPVKVAHPVTAGGIGAVQLAFRLDEANLNDTHVGIHGGNETNLTFGINWWPTSFTRVNLNYVRVLPISGQLTANSNGTSFSRGTYEGKSADIVALRLEYIY